MVQDSKEEIKKLTNEILTIGKIGRKTLEESKIETNKTLNKKNGQVSRFRERRHRLCFRPTHFVRQ
jgi:hypothetical protein